MSETTLRRHQQRMERSKRAAALQQAEHRLAEAALKYDRLKYEKREDYGLELAFVSAEQDFESALAGLRKLKGDAE